MSDDRTHGGARPATTDANADVIVALLDLAARPALARGAVDAASAAPALRSPIDAVAASSTDTLHLASLLAHARGIPMAYVRQQARGHGLRRQIEGRVPPGGAVLLLVEDVAAEQTRIAEGALREAGAGSICILPVTEILSLAATTGAVEAVPSASPPAGASGPRGENVATTASSPATIARDVAAALLDIGAVALNLAEPYTYTSGLRSPIYTDNRLLMSHPAA
ncbi:MAG: hypothetical protein FJ033_15580, partial [Chloroflexi bacterium]|nr:hypothetical protein [Chloroflexota bacterium]